MSEPSAPPALPQPPASAIAAATRPPPAPAAPPAAPPPASADAGSSSGAPKPAAAAAPKPWFNAGGDGGGGGKNVAEALKGVDTKAVVSAIKSKLAAKLSKPKGSSSGGIAAEGRKTGISKDELLRDQQAHEAKLLAAGKAVPHYRKR